MELKIDPKDVIELAAQKLADEAFSLDDNQLWDMAKKNIEARIDKLFDERTTDTISEVIDKAVKDGFDRAYQPVDKFGKSMGSPTTVRKELDRLIGGYWTERVDRAGKPTTSSYSSVSRAEWMMVKICADDFTEHMKQAAVNVTGQLKDGLRDALRVHVDKMLGELFHVSSATDQKEGRTR